MSSPVSFPTAPVTQTTSGSSPTGAKSDPLASKDQFLQLLVAQIKNQNPLNPSDGSQFVSQLAQFSDLEQSVNMRKALDSIQATLESRLPVPSSTSKS